jgi:hypothetical protein
MTMFLSMCKRNKQIEVFICKYNYLLIINYIITINYFTDLNKATNANTVIR